jgi:fucose 4-O-acetylase-like acetyltransferase
MKPGRLTWIDYAKGIAIILVLYRHVFEGIKASGISVEQYIFLEHDNIIFYSFRIPLFFIVSGIFVGGSLMKRGLYEFITTKVRTILYPYFLWATLQIVLQLIFSKYTNAHRAPSDFFYLFYQPREIEQFWYLYALFNVSVLYALVKEKLKFTPIQNIGLGIILLFISALSFQMNVMSGFLRDIFHYYIFFAIGDAISRFMNDRNNFKYFESWKTFLLLLVPFILAQRYFLDQSIFYAKNLGDTKYEFFEYYQPFKYLFIALIGCATIMSLTFILQKYKAVNWLQVLGRHSLYIYVSHVIVFASLRVFMTKVLGIYNVPVLLTTGIIAGLFIPVLLYKLAVKINMRWLFTLEKKPFENENKHSKGSIGHSHLWFIITQKLF